MTFRLNTVINTRKVRGCFTYLQNSSWASKIIAAIAFTSLLTACGGSSSSNSNTGNNVGNNNGNSTNTPTWVAGEFSSYSSLEQQCAANNTGSEMAEKLWQRSYSNDTYLWYDEIADQDPAPYSVIEYFHQLKTPALTPSGRLKDRFHFTMSTEEWQLLTSSGASVGYGFNIAIKQGAGIDRTITVTYSEPNSPALAEQIGRGALILEVNGVDVATANDQVSIDALNHGLFPSENGQQTTFLIQDLAAEASREITLTAQTIVSDPVPIVDTFTVDNSKVGYLVFNDHIATAEKGLFDAFNQLEAAAVDELIIDFRYNGGGYLAIASQLGYMVGGNNTKGKTFEKTIFNDKYPTVNPITGRALSPTPFYNETVGLNSEVIIAGVELPTVNLSRVFVLTTAGTCSASEAFINGMRGIDIEVIQIGSTTCGKPYGFYATDNCDTTYFTVQFKGENNKGFGDYADGFSPSEMPSLDTDIQGCEVADDLTHPLGDQQEKMLATARYYLQNGQCPITAQQNSIAQAAPRVVNGSEFIIEDMRARAQFSKNRILTR